MAAAAAWSSTPASSTACGSIRASSVRFSTGYAAVAWRFGTELVTRDREQRERVAELMNVHTPAEALAHILASEPDEA